MNKQEKSNKIETEDESVHPGQTKSAQLLR